MRADVKLLTQIITNIYIFMTMLWICQYCWKCDVLILVAHSLLRVWFFISFLVINSADRASTNFIGYVKTWASMRDFCISDELSIFSSWQQILPHLIHSRPCAKLRYFCSEISCTARIAKSCRPCSKPEWYHPSSFLHNVKLLKKQLGSAVRIICLCKY